MMRRNVHKPQQTVYHKDDEIDEECKKLLNNNNQQYHNHKITHYPGMAMESCRDDNRRRACIDCFTDVIIRDF